MAMQMQRAFNAKFFTTMSWYSVSAGKYNEDNDWVAGKAKKRSIRARLTSGNKFSQFEEGQAIHSEDGGVRISDFRSIYVTRKFPIQLEDKIGYKGLFFNVLQRSDEDQYGFYSYLIEKSEEWKP